MGRSHRDNCSNELQPHVVYEQATDSYRAVLRCPCGARKQKARHPHSNHAAAEAHSRVLRPARPRPRRVPQVTQPVVPPVDIDVAFVLYWRGLCAQNGYQSRL